MQHQYHQPKRWKPYVAPDGLLYQHYKDNLDPLSGVPNVYMSVRRASAFAGIGAALVRRQLAAGLLPFKRRGTRMYVNPADIWRLNYNKDGVRQTVKLDTGARKKNDLPTDTAAEALAMRALTYYPEWLADVDDYLAAVEAKNGTTAQIQNTPRSITNRTGDKTGEVAALYADMPPRMRDKAKWVRLVYDVIYQRRWMVTPEVSALTFLSLYMWGDAECGHDWTADRLGITVRTSKRYLSRIKQQIMLEAIRQGLAK